MNFCINVYGYLPRAAAAPMQKPNISRRQSQLDEDSDSDVYLDLDVDVDVAILSSCENGGVFGAIAFCFAKKMSQQLQRECRKKDRSVEIFAGNSPVPLQKNSLIS